MHDLTHAGYDWRSAVIWNLKGRAMCWTVQRDPARDSLISHVTYRAGDVDERPATGDWRRYTANGRVILMHNMGPIT